jgi:hypothetical protein
VYEVTVWPGRTADGPRTEVFPPVRRVVTVRDAQEPSVAISASRGGRLRLTLRPPDGKPSSDYEMSLRSDDGSIGLFPSQFLGKDGRTRRSDDLPPDEPLVYADAITPGRYRLQVVRVGLRPFETLVEIEAEQTTDVEARLERE